MTCTGSVPAAVAPACFRAPVWPLWIAPIVASIYYCALRNAFAFSIDRVVFDPSDVDFNDVAAPNWGSHWIYRIFAEMASLAFGTFVAAGIARQRAKVAAIFGAVAISAFYLLRNASWLYFVYFADGGIESVEPWCQHFVEVAIIVGAPFIGLVMSTLALELNGPKTSGFADINRLHFLWLWAAAALYAGGIISPLLRLWLYTQFVASINRLTDFMIMVVYGLPVAAFSVPILWGLITLAGKNEVGWSRTVNNIVGPVVIIVGWPVAVTIQFFWWKLVAWVAG